MRQDVTDGNAISAARAAELELGDTSMVSKRGQFKVNPTNIEELEEKRMRGYRFKPFPMAVHGWGIDPLNATKGDGTPSNEGPISIVVKTQAELEQALADGWSEVPLTGPAAGGLKAPEYEYVLVDARTGRTERRLKVAAEPPMPPVFEDDAPKKKGRKG